MARSLIDRLLTEKKQRENEKQWENKQYAAGSLDRLLTEKQHENENKRENDAFPRGSPPATTFVEKP